MIKEVQCIDKAAVLAEIKELKEAHCAAADIVLDTMEMFVDNLEVCYHAEPVSKDLEEEIDYLSKRYPEVSFAKLSRIAVHVANWQKEQMIKDAIKCPLYLDGNFLTLDYDLSSIGYKEGDKVKMIIIKEKEK